MAEQGLLTEVKSLWDGTELVGDVSAAATTITVLDSESIGTGDTLWMNGFEPVQVFSINYDTDVITLATGLLNAYQDASPVVPDAGGQPTQEWLAEVIMPDNEESIEVSIPFTQRTILAEQVYDPPIPVTLSDDLTQIIDVPGQTLLIPKSNYVLPNTDDVLTPTAAPLASALVKSVTGTTVSLVVETEALVLAEASTQEIHVWVDDTAGGGSHGPTYVPTPGDTTTLFTDTKSQVIVIDKLPDGTALDPTQTYYVVTYAHNILGYAPAPSPVVTGALDLDNIDALITAQLIAGFILAGSIQVGAILIDADTGITINDGATLSFPSDGVSPLSLVAEVIAESLQVNDALIINGGGTVYGNLMLANGIVDPTAAPTITGFYPAINTGLYTDGSDRSNYFADMIEQPDDTGFYVVAGTNFVLSNGTGGTQLLTFDRNTGAGPNHLIENRTGASKTWQTSFAAHGGLCSVAGDYYVCGQDALRENSWFIYRIDQTTFLKTDEVYLRSSSGFSGYRPKIAGDESGGFVAVVWTQVAGGPGGSSASLLLSWYDAATLTPGTGTHSGNKTLLSSTAATNIGGVTMGNDGTGTPKMYVSLRDSSTTKLLAWELHAAPTRSAPTPQFDFPRANGQRVQGIMFDSTAGVMLSQDVSGRLYHYGTYVNDTQIKGEHAWYDGDATGGTHETHVGPVRTFMLLARSQISLSVPSPPDADNPDTSNHDRANQVKLYMSDDAGVTWKYIIYTAPPWSSTQVDLSTFTTGTPNAGTGFPAAVAPAIVRSAATDTGFDGFTDLIRMTGDGKFRFGNYDSVRHFGTRSKSSNQSIPASTTTLVTFGTSKVTPTGLSWDNGGSNQWFLIAKPGIYLVQASIEWDATNVSAGSRREVGIFKNGTNYAWTDWSSSGFIGTLNTETQPISLMIPCVAGDQLDCRVFVGGGTGTPVIGGDDSRTYFSCGFMAQ